MERILKFLNNLIKCDKLAYSFYLTLGFLIILIMNLIYSNMITSIVIALFIAFILAIGKEFYDNKHVNHTSDIMDIVYGMLFPLNISLIFIFYYYGSIK